jgi:quercetin dioxygenase-like cupin family protein
MKKVLGAALLVCAAAFADETPKTATRAKPAVMMSLADLKFTAPEALPPGAPAGVQIARLWGDMSKGAYGLMVKFPPGSKNAPHWHTNDVRVIVIEGTLVAGPDESSMKEYGPGSYLLFPGGMRHVNGCKEGAECIALQEGSAKFDMHPAGRAQANK